MKMKISYLVHWLCFADTSIDRNFTGRLSIKSLKHGPLPSKWQGQLETKTDKKYNRTSSMCLCAGGGGGHHHYTHYH